MKNQKTLSKILIGFLILSCFAPLINLIPLTKAENQVFGESSYGSQRTNYVPNSLYGTQFASSGLGAGEWNVTAGHFYGYVNSASTGAAVKMLVIDDQKEIMGISNPITVTTGGEMLFNCTFTSEIILDKTVSMTYTLALIGAGQNSGMQYAGTGIKFTDTSNSYTSPVNPTDATNTSSTTGKYCIYLDISTYEPEATPTPTPSPSPAPTGLPVGTAILAVDAYADCNVSWNIQGSTQTQYEGMFSLPVGTVIEMTCTPDEGYYFYYWLAAFDEGSTQISVNPLHFTLYADLSLTAFVDAADLAELQTVTLQDSSGGRIYADYTPENWTGSIRFFSGTYQLAENSSLTIGGLPNTNYQFYRLTFAWNIAGVSLSSVEYETPVTVSVIGTLISKAYFTAGSLFPTPNPSGNAGTLGTVLDILTNTSVIALFIMVIVGVVGYYMAGAWGFFAGVNIAAVLLYMANQVFPLWGIVVLAVVDALLLYGKVSSSKNSSGPAVGD